MMNTEKRERIPTLTLGMTPLFVRYVDYYTLHHCPIMFGYTVGRGLAPAVKKTQIATAANRLAMTLTE